MWLQICLLIWLQIWLQVGPEVVAAVEGFRSVGRLQIWLQSGMFSPSFRLGFP